MSVSCNFHGKGKKDLQQKVLKPVLEFKLIQTKILSWGHIGPRCDHFYCHSRMCTCLSPFLVKAELLCIPVHWPSNSGLALRGVCRKYFHCRSGMCTRSVYPARPMAKWFKCLCWGLDRSPARSYFCWNYHLRKQKQTQQRCRASLKRYFKNSSILAGVGVGEFKVFVLFKYPVCTIWLFHGGTINAVISTPW
jgi:hypothetical protein